MCLSQGCVHQSSVHDAHTCTTQCVVWQSAWHGTGAGQGDSLLAMCTWVKRIRTEITATSCRPHHLLAAKHTL
jgi:hypothetical protein